jgi:hypothetical protein
MKMMENIFLMSISIIYPFATRVSTSLSSCVNIQGPGQTAVHFACQQNKRDCALLLASHGADLTITNQVRYDLKPIIIIIIILY